MIQVLLLNAAEATFRFSAETILWLLNNKSNGKLAKHFVALFGLPKTHKLNKAELEHQWICSVHSLYGEMGVNSFAYRTDEDLIACWTHMCKTYSKVPKEWHSITILETDALEGKFIFQECSDWGISEYLYYIDRMPFEERAQYQ